MAGLSAVGLTANGLATPIGVVNAPAIGATGAAAIGVAPTIGATGVIGVIPTIGVVTGAICGGVAIGVTGTIGVGPTIGVNGLIWDAFANGLVNIVVGPTIGVNGLIWVGIVPIGATGAAAIGGVAPTIGVTGVIGVAPTIGATGVVGYIGNWEAAVIGTVPTWEVGVGVAKEGTWGAGTWGTCGTTGTWVSGGTCGTTGTWGTWVAGGVAGTWGNWVKGAAVGVSCGTLNAFTPKCEEAAGSLLPNGITDWLVEIPDCIKGSTWDIICPYGSIAFIWEFIKDPAFANDCCKFVFGIGTEVVIGICDNGSVDVYIFSVFKNLISQI